MSEMVLGVYQGLGILILLGVAYRIWFPIKIQHTNVTTTMTKEEYRELIGRHKR